MGRAAKNLHHNLITKGKNVESVSADTKHDYTGYTPNINGGDDFNSVTSKSKSNVVERPEAKVNGKKIND